eukprot:TRINITY_DN5593_c0_g1_i1.p1 TRINITY_DN5593_c0_g1~~TRINITY_DN5593_c0_g1_i1.p1  ORF type:complete len:454 (+),score=87.97 TRINITY_DN5593_c0_g1_i1:23-1363(+)
MLLVLLAASAFARPNVLFVMLDDVGTVDLSFHFRVANPGLPPPIATPAIDALAESGVVLTRHYSHQTCCPSRVALMTGKFAWRVGNPFPVTTEYGNLDPKYPIFPRELQKLGYKTHIVGKWGIDYGGPPGSGLGPVERGFDTFFGILGSVHNHYSKKVVRKIDWHRHNSTIQLDHPAVDEEPNTHSTFIFTREAVEIVSRHGADLAAGLTPAPFFLYLSFTAAHDPLQAPPQHLANPSCRALSVNHRRERYCGLVVGIDEAIANVTDALRTYGLLDNTIVVLTSDNGGSPSVGGYNYPLRGGKTSFWEGGVRSAAFVRIPGAAQPGSAVQRFDGLFHLVDWGPTLFGLINRFSSEDAVDTALYSLKEVDGYDMSDLLQAAAAGAQGLESKRTKMVMADVFADSFTLHDGEWKLALVNLSLSDMFASEIFFFFFFFFCPRARLVGTS